jgi:MFS family permease
LEALDVAWRGEMLLLGFIVLGTLALASLLGRRAPEAYGLKPRGLSGAGCEGTSSSEWSVRGAFSRYAIWGAILTFLTSMMAEFLIWTQVIGYWTEDVGYSLEAATGIYAVVGLIGIVSMPLMGKVADLAVQRLGREVGGRRLMLLLGPGMGMAACLLLLFSAQPVLAYAAAFVFALYWAIVPGGVVGYVGAVYGCRTLGKIWGLATLIVMGVGPFAGSFIGGLLRDLSGSYTPAIYYALGSFGASVLLAATLPTAVRPED